MYRSIEHEPIAKTHSLTPAIRALYEILIPEEKKEPAHSLRASLAQNSGLHRR